MRVCSLRSSLNCTLIPVVFVAASDSIMPDCQTSEVQHTGSAGCSTTPWLVSSLLLKFVCKEIMQAQEIVD